MAIHPSTIILRLESIPPSIVTTPYHKDRITITPCPPPVSFLEIQNSSPSHKIPSTAPCGSMPPPSCENVIPSVNLPGHLSGNSRYSTALMSRDCTCNGEQFDSRLQQLEKKVDCLMALQQQIPTPLKAPLSVLKREHVSKGKKGTCFNGKIFFPFQLQFGVERR